MVYLLFLPPPASDLLLSLFHSHNIIIILVFRPLPRMEFDPSSLLAISYDDDDDDEPEKSQAFLPSQPSKKLPPASRGKTSVTKTSAVDDEIIILSDDDDPAPPPSQPKRARGRGRGSVNLNHSRDPALERVLQKSDVSVSRRSPSKSTPPSGGQHRNFPGGQTTQGRPRVGHSFAPSAPYSSPAGPGKQQRVQPSSPTTVPVEATKFNMNVKKRDEAPTQSWASSPHWNNVIRVQAEGPVRKVFQKPSPPVKKAQSAPSTSVTSSGPSTLTVLPTPRKASRKRFAAIAKLAALKKEEERSGNLVKKQPLKDFFCLIPDCEKEVSACPHRKGYLSCLVCGCVCPNQATLQHHILVKHAD